MDKFWKVFDLIGINLNFNYVYYILLKNLVSTPPKYHDGRYVMPNWNQPFVWYFDVEVA